MDAPSSSDSSNRSFERALGEEPPKEPLADLELGHRLGDREPTVVLPVALEIGVDHGRPTSIGRAIFARVLSSALHRVGHVAPAVDGLAGHVAARPHVRVQPHSSGPGSRRQGLDDLLLGKDGLARELRAPDAAEHRRESAHRVRPLGSRGPAAGAEQPLAPPFGARPRRRATHRLSTSPVPPTSETNSARTSARQLPLRARRSETVDARARLVGADRTNTNSLWGSRRFRSAPP